MSKRVMRDCPGQRVGKPSVLPVLLRYFKTEKRSQRKPGLHSRSFTPRSMAQYHKSAEGRHINGDDVIAREMFFDLGAGTGCKVPAKSKLPPIVTAQVAHPVATVRPSRRRVAPQDAKGGSAWNRGSRPQDPAGAGGDHRRPSRPPRQGDEAGPAQPSDDDDDWVPDFIEDMFDNSDRHAVGMGLLERLFGGSKRSEEAKKERTKRPYFTYWVTVIQVVIFFVTVATYGFAPVGLDVKEVTAEIRMTSLSIEQVSINDKRNMWVGPRQSDLIHLGAKYTPCMRPDPRIEAVLAADSVVESQTACCIYNDNSGCVQTLEKDCSPTLSTWLKWTPSNMGHQNRTSGSVCGEDPKYCASPASTGSFIWKDDITEWPLCDSKLNATASDHHMTCEVVGRPCCVGIQGECIISTREYCDFRRGYFHEEASLCSQVYCMKDICGMITFSDPAIPDQFYRLFFSLFLHAGLLQLAITVFLQMTVMRDFEKVTGWWFMAIVYLFGGVAGSLASAIFIPYHVEAGPSGSQFAVLAVVFVEVLRWNKDRAPGATVAKLFIVFGVLFFLGMVLSDIDNFAHLFGLLFGILVCFGFRPYLTVCGAPVSEVGRLVGVAVCLLLAVALFAILVMVFYLAPVSNCHNCMYFNCIPFTSTYCADQDVAIRNVTEA